MKIYEKLKKQKSKDKVIEKNNQKKKWIHKLSFQKIAIFFLTLITITLLLSINFFTDKIFLKEGQIYSKDILSPRIIEFTDEEATKIAKEAAAKSVKEIYDLNLVSIENVEKKVDDIFLKIKEHKVFVLMI